MLRLYLPECVHQVKDFRRRIYPGKSGNCVYSFDLQMVILPENNPKSMKKRSLAYRFYSERGGQNYTYNVSNEPFSRSDAFKWLLQRNKD